MTLYPRKNLSVLSACMTLFVAGILMLTTRPALADETALRLEGVWFTCEFAKSQTPPDDGCVMFDDEGFEVIDGQLSYLRNEWSDETACRGNKKGQCFSSDLPDIRVSVRPVGKIGIEDDAIFVSYMACTQKFGIHQKDGFVEVIPDKKSCFWAKKRHFYVSRYTGKLDRK